MWNLKNGRVPIDVVRAQPGKARTFLNDSHMYFWDSLCSVYSVAVTAEAPRARARTILESMVARVRLINLDVSVCEFTT